MDRPILGPQPAPPRPRRVAVLMGGQSDEREVSVKSGETVASRLTSEHYRVKPVLIHADGRWEVPSGSRLTPAQVSHYKSGKLSANVRSKTHPNGEVRAQLQGETRASARGDSAAPAK